MKTYLITIPILFFQLTIFSQSLDYLDQIYNVLKLEGHYGQAQVLKKLEQIYEVMENDPEVDALTKAEVCHRLAVTHMAYERFVSSLDYYQKALSLNPSYTHEKLADVFKKLSLQKLALKGDSKQKLQEILDQLKRK